MLTRSPACDAEPLQHVGEALDLGEQVGVRDRAGVARLTLEVDGDLVAPAGGDVAVEAVVGDVELAADEPLGVRQVPLADGVPLGVPVEQLARLLGPEPLVVLGRLVVHPRARDEGVALGRLGRREGPVLGGQGGDAGGRIGHGKNVTLAWSGRDSTAVKLGAYRRQWFAHHP